MLSPLVEAEKLDSLYLIKLFHLLLFVTNLARVGAEKSRLQSSWLSKTICCSHFSKSVAENFSTLGKLFPTRRKPGTSASIWSKELEPAANLDGCRHCQLIHHLLLEAFDAESLIGLTSGVTTIVVDVFLGSSSINLPHFFTICVQAIKSITLWIQAANKGKNRLKIVRVEGGKWLIW